jgi:hypothetical protein
MTRRLLFLSMLLASCSDSTDPSPAPARTVESATRALDEALIALNWAQYDLFAVGGRDIVVSVQVDSAIAPHYFRVPRRPAVRP